MKRLWAKPFRMALNISLCLDDFCLAAQRENDSCWFLQLLAWLFITQRTGCLAELVELCHLMAELEQSTKNRAGQVAVAVSHQQDKCQCRGSCCWLDFNWKWREWGNNIPSLFIYPVYPAFPYLSGAALCAWLVLPTLSHCSGSRRPSPDFNFFTVPPTLSPLFCVSIPMFKMGTLHLEVFHKPKPTAPISAWKYLRFKEF